MGHRSSRKKSAHRVLVSFLSIFSCVAISTGTVLASDDCKVSLIQTLTIASRSAQQHTTPKHKYTRATLAAWEAWGNGYLARHGHPYVPPKRKVNSLRPVTPKEQDALFKIACQVVPIPTFDLSVDTLLPPEEVPPVLFPPPLSDVPALITELAPPPGIPTPPGGDTSTGSPGFPGFPIFFPIGGGVPAPPVPTLPVPPAGPVPEPGSFVLLATGIAALWALRGHALAARKPVAIVPKLP
jgi:hypothetical protein